MEIKNSVVLITGANGLVGLPTVKKCLEEGAKFVIAADKNIGPELHGLRLLHKNLLLRQTDLTQTPQCEKIFGEQYHGKNVEIVIHLAGIKGSPIRAKNSPADYLIPMLLFNTNVLNCAAKHNVKWLVYMSSVGVYEQTDLMEEESVWNSFPSKNDWHPGWAKRMGELVLDALKTQYKFENWTIIRPANIYGLNDNFSPDATVISSNIWKLYNNGDENFIECWGDGSAKRDFVFADDVANATIDVIKKEVHDIINFGSGKAVSIKETIDSILLVYKEISGRTKIVRWDTTKPNGDLIRRLSVTKQEKHGIIAQTSLIDGLRKTISHYHKRAYPAIGRYEKLIADGYYVGKLDEIIPNLEIQNIFKDIAYKISNQENKEKNFQYRIDREGVRFSPENSEFDLDTGKLKINETIEKNLGINQRWMFSSLARAEESCAHLVEYINEELKHFVSKLYSIQYNKVGLHSQITLYEEGDYIINHRDGSNEGRLCIVLIYLSDTSYYNDSGGRLGLMKSEKESANKEWVMPFFGNYVILDFTKNDILHEVEAVKNDFQRLCHITIAAEANND